MTTENLSKFEMLAPNFKEKFDEFIYTDVQGTLQLTGNSKTLVGSNVPIVIYANI